MYWTYFRNFQWCLLLSVREDFMVILDANVKWSYYIIFYLANVKIVEMILLLKYI